MTSPTADGSGTPDSRETRHRALNVCRAIVFEEIRDGFSPESGMPRYRPTVNPYSQYENSRQAILTLHPSPLDSGNRAD